MSLLSKLKEKFKNINEKTKNRVVATLLAGGIALSGAGIAGCGNSNSNDPNTNPPIVNPGGDENGGTQNPGDTGGTSKPDYTKFSQALQNVLTDSYYSDLITIDRVASPEGGDKNSFNSGKFKALPFAFLEDEGFDIEKIKNGKLKSHSNVYTINNDLFIECRVETASTKNYFTHYVVKYELTNQEINELNSIFVKAASSRHSGKVTYYQAPFFIQELSYLKEASLVSKGHITADSIYSLEMYLDDHNYNTNANHATYMGSVFGEKYPYISYHTFQTHRMVDNRTASNHVNHKCQLNTITLRSSGKGIEVIDSKNVFIIKNTDALTLLSQHKQEYEQSATEINLFSCESCNFEDINHLELQNELTK